MAGTVGAREDRVVVGIRVASCAHAARIPVIDAPPSVIEGSAGPCGRGVARGASRGEYSGRGLMDRIGRVVVIRGVASVTGGRKSRVIAVDVATCAGHRRVRPCQGEGGRAVIEFSVGPENSVVAELASSWEAGLDVIHRRSRRIVVIQVAGHAGSIGAGEAVVVVDVAISANSRRNGVSVREREAGSGVIKLAIRPLHGVVATLARSGEAELRVIQRRCCGVVVLHVAGGAGSARQIVIVVDMAVGADAWRISVRVGQREAHRTVIKRRRLPGHSRVARFTSLSKPSRYVVGIRCSLEVF